MAGNIKDEIISSFKHGTTLTKLIYINLGVFVVANLLLAILLLFNVNGGQWLSYLMLPANWNELLHQPWSILSYMFLHEGFIHLLFNVLTLYWMGKFFLEYATQHSLVGLYIEGGILGGIVYLLGINFFPYFANNGIHYHLLGASASVMAVTVATAVFAPDRPIRLMFIGDVKLKWMAIAFVVMSLLQISTENAGGQMAHIGGAIAGYIFAKQYLAGHDLSDWITSIINKVVNFIHRIGNREPKMKATYNRTESDHDYNYRKKQENDKIDKILDKIKSSGYDSLNDDEKKQLFGNNK